MGFDEGETARNIGADVQLDKRRRAQVVKGRLAPSSGSNAGYLWASEVLGLGLAQTQLKTTRADAFRLNRGQHAAMAMLAPSLATGARNIDPVFRHHRQVVLAWATDPSVPVLRIPHEVVRGHLPALHAHVHQGSANADATMGNGVTTQTRFAIAQRWRRSVRGRPWPGNNTNGAVTSPSTKLLVAQSTIFECLWCAQSTHVVCAHAGANRLFFASRHACLRRASATATLYCCPA